MTNTFPLKATMGRFSSKPDKADYGRFLTLGVKQVRDLYETYPSLQNALMMCSMAAGIIVDVPPNGSGHWSLTVEVRPEGDDPPPGVLVTPGFRDDTSFRLFVGKRASPRWNPPLGLWLGHAYVSPDRQDVLSINLTHHGRGDLRDDPLRANR